MFWTIQYKHSLSFLKRWTREDFISGGFWSTHRQLHKSPVDVPLWVMKMEKYLGFGARSPQRWVPPLPNSGARMDVTSPLLSHLFAYVNVKTTVYKKCDALFCYTLTGRITIPASLKEVSGYHGRLCWEEIFLCVFCASLSQWWRSRW